MKLVNVIYLQVVKEDENINAVTAEINELKLEQESLYKQIEEDKEKIKEIIEARDVALREAELLKQQVDDILGKQVIRLL